MSFSSFITRHEIFVLIMTQVPQVTKVNYLQHLIWLPKFYHQSSYLKWSGLYCLIFAISYILLLLYNLIQNPNVVTEQDIFAAGIYLEVILSKISIDKKHVRTVCIPEKSSFWSDDLMTPNEKKSLLDTVRQFYIFELLFWLFSLFALILIKFATLTHPKFIYDKNWPIYIDILYKFSFIYSCIFGYYLGNSHQTYFAYAILHNYYQIKILISYIRSGIMRYKTMTLASKMSSVWYQKAAEEVLLCSIQQYQRLKMVGRETAMVYGRTTLWHFLIAITVVSVGMHSILFNKQANRVVLGMVVLHIGFGAILCSDFGQLFSEAYNDLYFELIQFEWYSLNMNNQKLYYMFLIDAQRDKGIEVLPSVKLTRPVVAQFLKTIYSVIAVLRSMKA